MVRRHRLCVLGASILVSCLAALGGGCSAGESPPLALEKTIPLPGTGGRIDHLALDGARGWLFVAALGAGAVERVDLKSGRAAGRVEGLRKPQGVGVLPQRSELVVASGGDGALRFYREEDLAPLGSLSLGADADNVRIDPRTGHVVVGYGNGGLAIVEAERRAVLSRIATPAHPEGFQLQGERAYVNLPDAGEVGVVDLRSGRRIADWPNHGRRLNFPLAIDTRYAGVAVVYRLPARLVTFDPATGVERQALDTCGDADDLSFDDKRSRLYVICGDGHVDVFGDGKNGLTRLARIATAPGARTGLFDAGADRLYVAARAEGARPAAILVLRPQ
jgi:hypothetical protein